MDVGSAASWLRALAAWLRLAPSWRLRVVHGRQWVLRVAWIRAFCSHLTHATNTQHSVVSIDQRLWVIFVLVTQAKAHHLMAWAVRLQVADADATRNKPATATRKADTRKPAPARLQSVRSRPLAEARRECADFQPWRGPGDQGHAAAVSSNSCLHQPDGYRMPRMQDKARCGCPSPTRQPQTSWRVASVRYSSYRMAGFGW